MPPAKNLGFTWNRQSIPTSKGEDWMRVDPRAAQAESTRRFLEDRQQTRQEKLSDTMGLGTVATGLDIAGGVPQYLAGEAAGAMGIDPVSLLTRASDATGVNPWLLGAAGAGIFGVNKMKKLGKQALKETRGKGLLGDLTKNPRVADTAHTPFKIPQEMKAWQKKVLPEKVQEQLFAAKRDFPDLAKTLDHMTPLEVSKVVANPETVAKMDRLIKFLPHAKEMAAGMKLGEPKMGWYEASAKAIVDVFGVEDAPRFAALLAATSPQTSVENNLMNSLKIWTAWDRAGRPTDPKAIKYIMGQNVMGSGTEESVLGAWINNSTRALSAPNMDKFTLSGSKVDSFYKNLLGYTRPATLDAWMGNGMAFDASVLSGSATAKQLERGDPGMGPGYATISGRLREGANSLGMSTAQGQETYWSAGMPLYEASRKQGMDPRDFLQKGLLTPKLVRGTPDFSTLLKQGEYGNVLKQGGYEEPLSKMVSHQWPEKSFDLSSEEQRHAMGLAENLSRLQGTRRGETASRSFPGWNPETAHVYSTRELVPGEGFGVGSKEGASAAVMTAPEADRLRYHRSIKPFFQNPNKQDLINESLFPRQTIPDRTMTGLYTPPSGITQSQPGTASGIQLPVNWRKGVPSLRPDDAHALKTGEGIAGLLTMQNASAASGIVPHEGGLSYFVPRSGKATSENLMAAGKAHPSKYFTDTAGGVNVIEPGSNPLTGDVQRSLEQTLREPPTFNEEGVQDAVREAYPGTNLGTYVDRTQGGLLRTQGTGQLTKDWLADYDKMSPKRRRALDKSLRVVTSGLHRAYGKLPAENAPPVDVMNLIQMIKEDGIEKVRAGAARGAFLPTAAAAAYLGNAAFNGSSPEDERQ